MAGNIKLIALGAPETPLELILKFLSLKKYWSDNPINQENWGPRKYEQGNRPLIKKYAAGKMSAGGVVID